MEEKSIGRVWVTILNLDSFDDAFGEQDIAVHSTLDACVRGLLAQPGLLTSHLRVVECELNTFPNQRGPCDAFEVRVNLISGVQLGRKRTTSYPGIEVLREYDDSEGAELVVTSTYSQDHAMALGHKILDEWVRRSCRRDH
ncbi:MAG: hypothetical protein AKCLJLPJ_02356 [Fimbriimonadales bacterium]|nr:hypothetical protein [Fimbriimonadales bacterium]